MNNDDILKIENLKYAPNSYTIRWNITNLCNYYCDFCIQGNKEKHLKESKGESAKIRNAICDKIIYFIENKINNKYKNLYIYLIGGEITILNDFLTILEKLLKVNFNGEIEYHITTNLSADIEVYKKMRDLFLKNKSPYVRKLSIAASFYKEFTTEEEFIKKVKTIYNINRFQYYVVHGRRYFQSRKNFIYKFIFLCLSLLAKKNQLIVIITYPLITDEDYEAYQKFKRKYEKCALTINYVIIRNYKKSISNKLKDKLSNSNRKIIKVLTKDNKIYYFSNTSKISLKIKDGHFNPHGFLCDSGIHNLTINNLGVVSRCLSCPNQTIVGNILEDDINLLTDYLICPNNNCNCSFYKEIKNERKHHEEKYNVNNRST